jgi:modulator of FtsH protease
VNDWEVRTGMRPGSDPMTGFRSGHAGRNEAETSYSNRRGNYLNDGAPTASKEVPSASAKEARKFSTSLNRGKFGESLHELESGLLAKVYGLLAFSLVFSLTGGYVGSRIDPAWVLLAFPLAIGLIFAVHACREKEPWNLVLLYGFTFTTGLVVGPLVAAYVEAGYGAIVIQAAVATTLITVGLSAFALTIKSDLAGWSSYLFVALLALVGVSLVNLFIGDSLLYLATSGVGALIFSLYLIHDVNRIRYTPDTMGNAVVICLDIYLDIVNLFLDLIHILIAVAGEGD